MLFAVFSFNCRPNELFNFHITQKMALAKVSTINILHKSHKTKTRNNTFLFFHFKCYMPTQHFYVLFTLYRVSVWCGSWGIRGDNGEHINVLLLNHQNYLWFTIVKINISIFIRIIRFSQVVNASQTLSLQLMCLRKHMCVHVNACTLHVHLIYCPHFGQQSNKIAKQNWWEPD